MALITFIAAIISAVEEEAMEHQEGHLQEEEIVTEANPDMVTINLKMQLNQQAVVAVSMDTVKKTVSSVIIENQPCKGLRGSTY